MTDVVVYTDYEGRSIRLTNERKEHILEHVEMHGQLDRIRETLKSPELVIATNLDEAIHVYHRYYAQTPVTSKHLHVAVKLLEGDAFVVTAFFSNRVKKGTKIWPR